MLLPSYPVTVVVELQLLKDLLVTAVEGGSNYWASFAQCKRDPDTLDILSVLVCDREDDSAIAHTVTPETIATGLQRLADSLRKDPAHMRAMAKHLADAITEDGDAITADVVLQMACFGEVIFG